MTQPGITIQYDEKVSGLSRITQFRSVIHLVFKRFLQEKLPMITMMRKSWLGTLENMLQICSK